MPPRTSRFVLNFELALLTALSAVTHFWRLFTPNAVIFDEAHYEHHAGYYLDRTYYIDVHPPLGKLIYAAEARLFGVSASALTAFTPAPVPAMRLVPALFGALFVPLIYVLCRELGAARRVAALGAFAILCENALLVDSRFILLEPLLIFFGLAGVVLCLEARRRRWNLMWLAAAATLAGCALSVKWTGASALGVMLATWAWDARLRLRQRVRLLVEGVILLAFPATVYIASFAVHFAILTHHGVNDAGMSPRFQQTLIGNAAYRPGATMSLAAKIADVHHAMNAGNRGLEGVTHAAASPWYTWPIMKHPIGLWQAPGRNVILLGNPAVWWGGCLAVLFAAIVFIRRRCVPRGWRFALAFALGGYLLDYLPFIAITRVMYIYHYLFGLVWIVVLATLSLSAVFGWNEPDDDVLWRFPTTTSAAAYAAVAATILIGFIYFLPFSFGWPLSQAGIDARFWVLHPHL